MAVVFNKGKGLLGKWHHRSTWYLLCVFSLEPVFISKVWPVLAVIFFYFVTYIPLLITIVVRDTYTHTFMRISNLKTFLK